MTPEKRVQNNIIKYLTKLQNEGHPIEKERRQAGGFSYKKGVPDIWFSYAGIRVEIEVKKPGGKLSSSQELYQRIYDKNLIINKVFDNISDFKNFMKTLIKNRDEIERFMKTLISSVKDF